MELTTPVIARSVATKQSPPTYQVLCGDARNLPLDDGTVQAIVTSVPYWGLRRYIDDPREIGREDTLPAWLDNLVACAREWWRVLRDDGTLWLNCGDSYTAQLGQRKATDKAGPKQQSNPGSICTPSHYIENLKSKNLICLPWRLAFALQSAGWYLRSAIVWVKGLDWTDAEREAQQQIKDALNLVRQQAAGSLWGLSQELDHAIAAAEQAVDRLVMSGSVMPESVQDRPTSAYEMLFLFSKAERYYYDREAIKSQLATSSVARISQPTFNTQSGGSSDYKKTNVNRNRSARQAIENLADSVRSGSQTRNARNVWRVPVENAPSGGYQLPNGRTINHFASYPRALAARAIRAATSAHGACAQCGAPWQRVIRPTPAYAELLGQDWADYDQDAEEGRGHSVSPQRPTKRGPTATAEYITEFWEPTCRCFGDPIPANVPCPKCGGTCQEKKRGVATEGWVTGTPRLEMLNQLKLATPCPVCLCPDCQGTGREHTSAPRQAEHFPTDGQRKSGKRGIIPNLGANSMVETDNPCPTCNGIGATGRVNGEVWDADTLAQWPRRPCIVLDPMAGTGQTGMAALDLGRSVILNDLHPDYCALMEARLSAWPDDLRGPKKQRDQEPETEQDTPQPTML